MLVDLRPVVAVVVSSLAWGAIGLVSGFAVHRLPLSRLDHDTWLTRPRRFERNGRFYDHLLHIRRWKDHLPEKGDVFRGGYAKRRLHGYSDVDLERFEAETRRAETVHWINFAAGPFFLLWCPPMLGLVMVGVGCCHLPFVMVQRYNRARERTLVRRHARSGAVRPWHAPSPYGPASPRTDGSRLIGRRRPPSTDRHLFVDRVGRVLTEGGSTTVIPTTLASPPASPREEHHGHRPKC